MAADYASGGWLFGQGVQAVEDTYDEADLKFLYGSEETTHDKGLTKNEKAFERWTRWAAIDLLPGQRLDRIISRGLVYTKDVRRQLTAAMGLGGVVGGVTRFIHGGNMAVPVPKLCCKIVKGLFDPDSDPGAPVVRTIYAETFHTCRVDTFIVFQEGDQVMYEQHTVGIYNDRLGMLESEIAYHTDQREFNKGATSLVRGDPDPLGFATPTDLQDRRVQTWRLTMVNGADPRFTTVKRASLQADADRYTLPTGFEEGAVGAALELLMYADEDAGEADDEFDTNRPRYWDILTKPHPASNLSLKFILPYTKYRSWNIEKNGKSNQLQRGEALGLYSPLSNTGLIAELDDTP